MADGVWGALVPEIANRLDVWLGAWSTRNEVKAVKLAGSLGFWRDGMLDQLSSIAAGKGTDADFRRLEEQFEESEEPVRHLIKELKGIREKILGNKDADAVIKQIDIIIFDKEMGKNRIRERIQFILDNRESEYIAQEATITKNEIEALNAAISRLGRLVYGT